MAEKRKRSGGEGEASSAKKKRGFTVGPANLPDGTYKRKTQKIKGDLIERARIWKDYEKQKRQGKVPDAPTELPTPASAALDRRDEDRKATSNEDDAEKATVTEPTTEPHPDRQGLMDRSPSPPPSVPKERQPRERRQRRPKPVPFAREQAAAQQRKEEAEERRRAREEAERQRQQKMEDRERFRKAMAKARTGGKNGQRKLGRESNVLLEKVKRMVGE